MLLPQTAEYGEAIQDLPANFCDPEIRAGQTSTGRLGQPLIWTGNFAAVFQVCGAAQQQKWALKCFTRQVKGLQERYRRIDAHLRQQRLPFMVGFRYLPDEVLVRGQRFPVLKMDWVEGLRLDEFLADCFEKGNAKGTLRMLCEMWVKLAQRMRAADVAHGDLQHGNVILVPVPDKEAYNLRLIDYDGLHVPALAGMPPGEVGHAAYQHPERLATGAYGPETDRFSHLLIYTTLRCLIAGGRELWDRHYNEDRLLVGPLDLREPETSKVFEQLWKLEDAGARTLTGHLLLAAKSPLAAAPQLEAVVRDSEVAPLTGDQLRQVERWLPRRVAVLPQPPKSAATAQAGSEPAAATVPAPVDAATAKDAQQATDDQSVAAGQAADAATPVERPRRGNWRGRLSAAVSGGDRLLVRAVGQENRTLLAVLRPLAALGCLIAPLMLMLVLWQAGSWLRSHVPVGLDVVVEPEQQPAVYLVRIVPAEALLTATGSGVSIDGDGSERTVTVAAPDGEAKNVLLAVLSGYENQQLEVQPVAGETEELLIELVRIPEPAVYRVAITPAEARLTAVGQGITVTGAGAQRTVTVAVPDGEATIELLAVLSGYEDRRLELQPVGGETEDVVIELVRTPTPAVYRVAITPPEAQLTAVGQGINVTGEGAERTVAVAAPDGEASIELLAVMSGYEDRRLELQPVGGKTEDVVIELVRIPAPADEGVLVESPTMPMEPVEVGFVRLSEPHFLVRYVAESADWFRLPSRTRLMSGDRLLVFPTYRPEIVLTPGIQVVFAGPSSVQTQTPNAHGEPELAIQYGRALIAAPDVAGAKIHLNLAGHMGVITFEEAASEMGVDVSHYLPPGTNPELEAAWPVAQIYTTVGRIGWQAAGATASTPIERGQVRVLSGAQWQTMAVVQTPDWMQGTDLRDVDRLASDRLEPFVMPDRPVSLTLVERTEDRVAELRSLAARCLAYLDSFERLVREFGDARQRSFWTAEYDSLRHALLRSPKTAARLRETLEAFCGEDAEDLYRLSWGYSVEQLREGADRHLVDLLDHDSLRIRVFAFENLRRITGKTLLYRPEAPAARRKSSIQHWREQLHNGAIIYEMAPSPLRTSR